MADSKKDLLLGNFAPLGRARTSLLERRLAHIGELAALLCDEAGEEEIFFRDPAFAAKYRHLTAASLKGEEPGAVNREKVGIEEAGLGIAEKAFLCRRIADLLGITGIRGADAFFEEEGGPEDGTVAYMKNTYADAAFTAFSPYLPEPKVRYGKSFSEVCEDVFYRRASYCILPVESSRDGRLAGFRAQMMKYGLKTAYTVRIETAEGESTDFALLRRGLSVPKEEGRVFLELRIRPEGGGLAALATAAAACRMKTLRMTPVPGEASLCDALFEADSLGLCGFLSFLYLEYEEFTITGLFGEIPAG